jgi:hypothetical protein
MKTISFTIVFSFALLIGYAQTNSPTKAAPSEKTPGSRKPPRKNEN